MVNFLELERLALPSLSLVISYLAGVLLIVGLATPGWVKLDVFRGEISSGNITFGLIRGVEYIDTRHGTLMDSFYTFSRYQDVLNLTALYVIVICTVLAVILCVAAMAFEFVNAYQVVKEWWRGPATIYIISIATAALTSISVGAFADFYMYDIDSVAILNYTRLELISLDGYTTTSNLNYSTYIFFVGAALPIIPIFFSWRLTAILPDFYNLDVLETMNLTAPFHFTYEMEDMEDNEDELQEESDEEVGEGGTLDDYHYPAVKEVPTIGGYLSYQ